MVIVSFSRLSLTELKPKTTKPDVPSLYSRSGTGGQYASKDIVHQYLREINKEKKVGFRSLIDYKSQF